ncbi:MAG: Gfo/Idh/MocA family oxidoreductase [Chloroflexi bacterium]|nr:Gfo/Idh/MocA family oxidoreductase [Chloroflexota bacterium]MDA1296645.1 Gfo/Idh/MocA family oxidoreductase [Chloroflexota bacterium]
MTSSRKLRIGLIGAGGFANTHMQHLSRLGNAEVVSFMRRDRGALEAMQKRWNVPEGYTDYREMLEKSDIDAVDIVTPTDSHRQIAIDAAAAGKHILCDKPLALTAQDCRDMLDAAEKAGVIHSTNFNQRGNMPVGRIKRYVDAGYVGKLYHLNIWWGMSLQHNARPEVLSWRFKPESGGGSVYEIIHVFDMARFFGGEVARVTAMLNTAEARPPFADRPEGMDVKIPDSSAFMLEFVNGGYAVIHTSFVSRGTDPDGGTHARVEVTGSTGRIESDGRFGLKGYSGDARGPLAQLEPGPDYTQPYERFVNACLAGDQSLVETSFFDGLKAAEIVDAAYRSWETKSWVDLPR